MSTSTKETVKLVGASVIGMAWGTAMKFIPAPLPIQLALTAGGGFLLGAGFALLVEEVL